MSDICETSCAYARVCFRACVRACVCVCVCVCVHACVYTGKGHAAQFIRVKSLVSVRLGEFICLLRFRLWVGDLVLLDVFGASCGARMCVYVCKFGPVIT